MSKRKKEPRSWFIVAHGQVTEHYTITAETEAEARALFDQGRCTLVSSEAFDCELHSIEEDK